MSYPIDVFEASAFRQTPDGFVIRVPGFWMIAIKAFDANGKELPVSK